jgi:hypothetical protein
MEHLSLEEAHNYMQGRARAAKGYPAFPATSGPPSKRPRLQTTPSTSTGKQILLLFTQFVYPYLNTSHAGQFFLCNNIRICQPAIPVCLLTTHLVLIVQLQFMILNFLWLLILYYKCVIRLNL